MPRPTLPPEQRREPVRCRMNAAQRASLAALADLLDCSESDAIVWAVEQSLRRVKRRRST